jgi:hypothetical protein
VEGFRKLAVLPQNRCKYQVKDSAVAQEIFAIEKKTNSFHRDHRKEFLEGISGTDHTHLMQAL